MQRAHTIGRSARAKVALAMAAAAAMAGMTAGAARADVTVGQDWNPVSNSIGYTYYDGFTSYSGNLLAQVPSGTGNTALQIDITNPYWGQFTGQSWANNNLSVTNFNANPRI